MIIRTVKCGRENSETIKVEVSLIFPPKGVLGSAKSSIFPDKSGFDKLMRDTLDLMDCETTEYEAASACSKFKIMSTTWMILESSSNKVTYHTNKMSAKNVWNFHWRTLSYCAYSEYVT